MSDAREHADPNKRGGMLCQICKKPILDPSMTRPYLCGICPPPPLQQKMSEGYNR